jgi:hypothetical protein
MSNNTRVLHAIRGFTLKHSQVLKGIEKCALCWVEFGKTFRDLTPAEAILARNQQAKEREPLAFAELPHLVYRPTEMNQAGHRQELRLAKAANRFAEQAA